MFTTYAVTVGDSLWTDLYGYVDENMPGQKIYGCFEDGEQKFAVLHNEEDNKFYRLNFSLSEDKFAPAEEVSELTDFSQEAQFKAEDVEAFETEFKKKKEEEEDKDGEGNNPNPEDKSEGNDPDKKDGSEEDPEDDDDKKKKKKTEYNLDDIVEYQELLSKYNELENSYNELKTQHQNLTSEIEPLKQFKLETERKDKEAMINGFYMLSDEDKKDVIDNIDTYSLDDIEAKLSIICVRNKVNFNLEDEKKENAPLTFNFDNANGGYDASTPAWVKAALEVAKDMN